MDVDLSLYVSLYMYIYIRGDILNERIYALEDYENVDLMYMYVYEYVLDVYVNMCIHVYEYLRTYRCI